MKAEKSFWQRHLAKVIGFVITVTLFGSIAVLRHNEDQQKRQELGNRLTMFKQPPKDAAEGGHWHADGTWHNEPHIETKTREQVIKPQPKTSAKSTESHPHDLLTDEEHDKIHQKEREKMLKEIKDLKADTARIQAEMKEDERAAEQQRGFEKLIPNFQKQVLEVLKVEDYDFILTYPTPVQIIEKFSTPVSLNAFCERLLKYQSIIIQVSNEINKRPDFAKRMQREYPDFMENLNKVKSIEIPQFYAEGTK